MNSHAQRAEAHDQAGEEFANALRRSFPSIAGQITEGVAISFYGTIKGRDVVCTFERTEPLEIQGPSEFPRHYDPTSPEVVERRKRLFAAINAGHSEESARALRELARAYSGGENES